MMLKGMTVEFLLRRTFQVKPGDIVLFHAAAGGVGLIFGQWAKHLGATVIGTAGSPEKIALAKAHGFDHVINYRDGDFVAAVREITGGRMCDVVYDSVGKDTFPGSLDCLRPLGMFVSFGQSSGPIPPFSISHPGAKGLALRDPADAVSSTSPSAPTWKPRPRRCSRWWRRERQGGDQSAPQAGGCREGACRPRRPQDHRHDVAHSLRNVSGFFENLEALSRLPHFAHAAAHAYDAVGNIRKSRGRCGDNP